MTQTLIDKTVLQTVGKTPMVFLPGFSVNSEVKIFAKLEGNNPGGSVKDRPAYNMIKCALERGDLKPGDCLIEATSGNTGIALALFAKLFGVEIELVMPEGSTEERIKTMKAYGAKVTLTPESQGMEGAIDYANNKLKNTNFYMLNQFSNDDNWKAHYFGTGPEIWNDSNGEITHFVSAMGTTGTIMGVSTYLKEVNKKIEIVGAQPSDGSKIPGIRKWEKQYLPEIFNPAKVDRTEEVHENEARNFAKKMALEQGILCGMSSGGAAAIAYRLSQTLKKGYIVFIVCDRGDRYLSTDLFN
jgi:cysteine synthase B